MSENEKSENSRPKLEHVALEVSSVQKINTWLEQASAKKKGVKISRKDFINWLIEKSPDNLSGGDLSALIDRFYDEAKFLRHLLREVNQAKADGKTDTGFELVVKTKKLESKREVDEVEERGRRSRRERSTKSNRKIHCSRLNKNLCLFE